MIWNIQDVFAQRWIESALNFLVYAFVAWLGYRCGRDGYRRTLVRGLDRALETGQFVIYVRK